MKNHVMFKKNLLSDAINTSFTVLPALLLLGTTSLAFANEGPEEPIEIIEVKGERESAYKSGNMDIPRSINDVQPYTVIGRQTIENSGATSVVDLLKQVLPMSTSGIPEDAGGWTGTSSQINLRGLGASHTLILVNGRRGAGIGSRGTSESTDQQNINNIPLAAIERIEVLPTSASAIYGSNAIGGVINVILKRDYVGTEVNVRYGNTFDSDTSLKTANFTTGFALEGGRTQVLISAQKQEQNELLVQDREFATRGRATILLNNPDSIYEATQPIYGNLVNIRSVNGSPLFPEVSNASFTYIPQGYQGAAIDGVQPLIDNLGKYSLGLNPGIGTYSGVANLVGANENESVSLNVNRDFTDKLNVFLDVGYDSSTTKSAGNYHGFGIVTLNADAPNNPFGQRVYVAYPAYYSYGIEQQQRIAETETKRAALGFSYDISPNWLINADYSYSNARVDVSYQRRPTVGQNALTADFQNGTLDILRDTTTYALDLSKYWAVAPNFSDQKLHDFTLRSTGTVASWYAGDIQLATGLEHRILKSDSRSETQVINNPDAPITHREQNTTSIYAEFTVPFVSPEQKLPWAYILDVQIAARHERFDVKTAGTKFDATSPTIGFRYAPNEQIMLRASYSEGFVAPTVSQIAQPVASEVTNGTIQDPLRGGEVVTAYEAITGGNPDLTPETSESKNLGLVITPNIIPNLRLSIDYYDIEKTNNITSLSAQTILNNLDIYGYRVTRAEPSDGYSVGRVTSINTSPTNALGLETSGIDTHLSYSLDAAIGELTFSLGHTYVKKYLQQAALGAEPVDYVGIPSAISDGPIKHRGNASVFLQANDNWGFGWNAQYYGAYQIDPSSTVAIESQGTDTIGSQLYHDVFARARFLPAGVLKDNLETLELTFGIRNLFNDYKMDLSASNYYSTFGDPRLRNYYLNLKVGF